jgi:uncharacterized protein YgfB (UPF0149 family)
MEASGDGMSEITERCNVYLLGGGLWNPELASHDAVRDLIIDCRDEIYKLEIYRDAILHMCSVRYEDVDEYIRIAKQAVADYEAQL